MNPNKTPAFFLIVVTSILLTANTLYAQARPVLLFSDLTWGPKTGWEGSATKGAAVTIWGKNVGSANGTNKITACGIDILSNDSTYVAEWGVTGTANHVARGLERITFWLKNTMTDGSGTISVTVGGVTSNTIPFTIAAGKIYFISVSDGDNSYNGLYSTRSGHSGSDGPFKDLLKFNPSNNPSGDSQYICYVRGGTYTTKDVDSTFVALRGPYGGPTKQKALIAYPAEVPTIDTTSAGRGIIWNANYDPYGMNSYFTYSKLYGVGGWTAIGNFGNYNRTIGCHFKDYLSEAWTGVVWVSGSRYTRIYGNYFDHNGYDSYKHNIYIKTQPSISGVDYSTQYTDVGWNEISNPVAGSDNRGGAIFISKSSDSVYDTRYVYIHDNYFHDGNMEFIYTGDNTMLYDIYIYDNIFTGGTAGSGSVFLAWHTDSVYLFNNTFYNTISPIIRVTGATHAILRNNIYYANNGQTFFEIDPYQGATISSDHDLFYNSSGGGIPSGPGITLTNGKTGNPLFVNPAAKDFHLQPTSPAIDAGSASVSSTVTQGYDGNSRPQGSGYDIGAYEYAAGGESESFYFDTVQEIYIGYYQRPADPGGLIYWAERLDATGGNLTEIIEAFANSAESQALYGTINSSNISTVVNGIYNALFGRDAEAGGLSYYVNGFNSGYFTAATIMLNVLYGAQNEDLQSVNNKVTAANLFTRTIDPDLDGKDFQYNYSGNADAQRAREFLLTVTWDPATIPTEDEIRAFLEPEASATIGPAGGIVEVTNPSSPLYGVKVEVPAGALDKDTTITINNRISELPAPDTAVKVSKTISLSPENIVFNVPVTITIPYDATKVSNETTL
jgi:hypothetical protein